MIDASHARGPSDDARLIARAASAGVATCVPAAVGLLLSASSVDAAPGDLDSESGWSGREKAGHTRFEAGGLPERLHHRAARARDESQTGASKVTIESGPAPGQRIASRQPIFTFSSSNEEVERFECRIGSEPYVACSSPYTPEPLSDGRHRFVVRSVSAAGGADSVPAWRGFVVDTKPPRTIVLRGPGRRIETIARRAPTQIRFRATERARFECRVGARRWRRCTSPLRLRLGPGWHRLRIRAIDLAGNVERRPARRMVRVIRWRPNLRAAGEYARSRQGSASFAVDVGWRRYVAGGSWTAPMASTVKVVLMAAYLRKPGVRSRGLSSYERSRIEAMIRHSDNVAATSIAGELSHGAVERLGRGAGMKRFSYESTWGRSQMSASGGAALMRSLPRLTPERHRRFVLSELASIVDWQRWGIAGVAPRGWNLHFKGGWGISDGTGGTVNHQLALLRRGGQRIGVAILTRGNTNHAHGTQTLRGIAARLVGGLPRTRKARQVAVLDETGADRGKELSRKE